MSPDKQARSRIPDTGLAYCIMFYLGVGSLFPWNALINASTYYSQRFCGTQYQSTFENYFSTAFTTSQASGLLLSALGQNMPISDRIIWPLLAYSVIFGANTLLVVLEGVDYSALCYFSIATAVLLSCVLAYTVLGKLRFT
ncbi:hypothetical protein B484DRAFT_438894, partial [Ochromonadaceae sp. CCMP2298]